VNVPLSGGKTDKDYLFIFEKILAPIALAFKPEVILVSAGFDIYHADPLGGMKITGEGFGALTASLMDTAAKTSKRRLLFALEGGYNLGGLQEGVKAVLFHLSKNAKKPGIIAQASPQTEKELAPVIKTHKKFWPLA
jgi:acetoin utilization deacetylase AcuC-like enzyme